MSPKQKRISTEVFIQPLLIRSYLILSLHSMLQHATDLSGWADFWLTWAGRLFEKSAWPGRLPILKSVTSPDNISYVLCMR